jgi:hypothetical protein
MSMEFVFTCGSPWLIVILRRAEVPREFMSLVAQREPFIFSVPQEMSVIWLWRDGRGGRGLIVMVVSHVSIVTVFCGIPWLHSRARFVISGM